MAIGFNGVNSMILNSGLGHSGEKVSLLQYSKEGSDVGSTVIQL